MSAIESAARQKLDGSLASLSAAAAALDPAFAMQAKLAVSMLTNAVSSAGEELTPASMIDVEFALNDLKVIADDLPGVDRETFTAEIDTIQDTVRELKSAAALPPALLGKMETLRLKLKERRTAIDREQYRPPEKAAEPLPHDAPTLRAEASEIRHQLNKAGFATPELDALVDQSGTFYMSDVTRLIEELEVIAGN